MKKSPVILGTHAYLHVTFPVAIVWHLVLFKSQYEAIGYIGREKPLFLFGFLSILIQGFILSALYPVFSSKNFSAKSGLIFAAWAGAFHWTVHVLAFAAKGDIQHLPLFFTMETVYLALQFGIFGLLISALYRRTTR
jgi:hypothetical protein